MLPVKHPSFPEIQQCIDGIENHRLTLALSPTQKKIYLRELSIVFGEDPDRQILHDLIGLMVGKSSICNLSSTELTELLHIFEGVEGQDRFGRSHASILKKLRTLRKLK